MANRYWIGGTGDWTDTAHWSDAQNGVGGFSVPTQADNVFFTSNSGTGTITVNAIASMLDFDVTGLAQNITLANAAYAFNVYGSLALSTKLATSFTGTGYLYLKATSTGKTITSNGNTSGWNRLYFDGVGGTWTNQDDWNSVTSTNLTNGTWNQSIYNISNRAFGYGVGTAILTMTSGTFLTTEGCYFHINSGGKTFNCGTGKIKNISTTGGGNLYVGTNTFYDVEAYCISSGGGSGLCTFRNLTVTHNGVNGFIALNEGLPSWVINGTFTVSGYNAAERRISVPGLIGTQRTITVNGSIIASNVDFRDIKGAGTANWDLSGIDGGSGDCGGNSGIIFTPAQPQWYKHTSGDCSWSDSTKWFRDQAKTIAGRVPLPQDDATFDATSFTGVSTLNVNCTRIGRSLNMEGVNQDVTFSLAKAIECYGSFVLGNNITCYGGFSKNLLGIGDFVINTFNKNIPSNFTIYRGNYTANSNITLIGEAGNQMLINGGNFNLNGFNLSCILFSTVTSGTVNLGSGTINLVSGNPVWSSYTSISSNTNLIATNSTISLQTNSNPTNDNPRIDALNKVFGKVIIGGNTTKAQQIVQSCTINELIINEGKKLNISAGKTVSIGNLTAIGTSINPITIGSTTTGSTFTLNKTQPLNEKIECDYLILQDSKVQPAKTWYAGKNSVNNGNNTGWDFDVFHSRDIILQPNKRILVDSNGRIVW